MSCPNGPLKILIDSDEASCGEEKIRTEFRGALFGKLGNLYETKEMEKAWNKGFGKIRMGTQATVASVQLGHGGAALEESVQTS
jgi:hypothetical protein